MWNFPKAKRKKVASLNSMENKLQLYLKKSMYLIILFKIN